MSADPKLDDPEVQAKIGGRLTKTINKTIGKKLPVGWLDIYPLRVKQAFTIPLTLKMHLIFIFFCLKGLSVTFLFFFRSNLNIFCVPSISNPHFLFTLPS